MFGTTMGAHASEHYAALLAWETVPGQQLPGKWNLSQQLQRK